MSTIQATNIKHASSASNNLALDSSGNATFANNVAVPSINSGPLAGFRNVIINGGFDIWQRGTSFTSTSVNEYSADRFRTEGNNLSTTISRQAFTANQTDVPGYPTYYCRVATSATVGVGQYWAFQQRVEAPQNLSGYEQITLTFYARATSGTIAANTFSFGSLATKVGNPALTTAWSKLTTTITLSGPSSGYVEIYLVYLAAGTTAVSIDIAQVQVELGPVSTPFEHRPISTELALCQRYFEKSYDTQTSPGSANTAGQHGIYVSGASSFFNGGGNSVCFAVEKRATPTITSYSGTTGASGKIRDVANSVDVNSNILYAGTRSFFGYASFTQTTNVNMYWQWTASAEL